MDNDPTKLTSFQPLTPDVSSRGFSLSKIFDFRKHKSRAGNLSVTLETPRKEDIHENVATSSHLAENVDHSITATQQKVDGHNKKDNLYSWLTESVSSQPKVFGGKEKVPEIRLTQSEMQTPRKEKWRYRNVRTILRRLSALTIDRRWHQTTGDFKHNFKQYWMPDEHCKECYECGDKFNTFRRRHHCRVCGQIFCYRCCSQVVPGNVLGFSGDIRVCCYCFKIVQAYLNDDLEKNIEALGEDIRAFEPGQPYEFGGSCGSLGSIKSTVYFDDSFNRIRKSPSSSSLPVSACTTERSPTPTQRSPFDAFGVAPSEAITIKQDYLRDLWRQITDAKKGIELTSHRYRLKTYHNCLVGQELNDWLVKHNKTTNRAVAVATGQALLDNGWIEPVYPTEDTTFKDEYMLYQPTKTALLDTETARLSGTYTLNYIYDSDEESNLERKFSTVEEEDDEEMPYWLKQLSDGKQTEEQDLLGTTSLSNSNRRFSAGRHLDLDHVTQEENDGAKKADLSIQMTLDASRLDDMKNEIYDPTSKISFITHVPPPSLDTYVCVEGHQTATKKKLPKQNTSSSTLADDILRGVVFPRPNTEPVSQSEEDVTGDPTKDENGERLARERISSADIYHNHSLLSQLLKQENLLSSWQDIILPFIAKVSDKVIPDVRRDDDMDIRRYVWLTKVPGGLKSDCHFISGVVFRKNVCHKRMTGHFLQPKILMMSCAIEYQRNENKMSSLDPLVLQEYAFLQNFVKRVLALKPNILLVEKNVARVAQEMFLAGGITLVHNIKPRVMENIARCCGADILQTMEQVTRPRLGTCQQFRLQKYTLPKTNETKTLMYFEGCAPDLGCSLILRGGNKKTLIKVKRIIKYLIYIAYHLKLEEKFLMDEFAMPPVLDQLTPQSELCVTTKESVTHTSDLLETRCGEMVNTQQVVTVELNESNKFLEALKLIVLSSSPFCNYPMPYLLTAEGKLCSSRHFIANKIYWSRYLDGTAKEPITLKEDDHEWVKDPDAVNPNIIVNNPHPFTDPALLLDCMEDGDKREALLNDFRARGGRLDLKMYNDYQEIQTKKVLGAAYDKIYGSRQIDVVCDDRKEADILDNANPDTQLPENLPDRKLDCFDAFNHQKIAVLFSSYSSESHNSPKPCISPWAVFMEFYGRNDITLGGFLERYCFRPSYICPSHNCDVPMVNHVRYFAHGQGSIYIHMRNLESPIPGYDRTILTWSWCKVCKQVTPVVPLSFECWSMSFAKYLELRFYASGYTRRASVEPCGHSLHHDHYQYFSYANMVASFKYRAIELYEVIIPPFKIHMGKQGNVKPLLDEITDVNTKVELFAATIMERVNALKNDKNIYSSNSSREAIISEFIADVQREKGNMQDCIHVINQKTELFSRSPAVEEQQFLLSSSSSSLTKSTETSPKNQHRELLRSNSGISVATETSVDGNRSKTGSTSNIIITEVTEYDLMIDIGNKLFHLKKNMCESVENWNSKLQEFIAQDRKREKAIRSASPTKNTVAGITEVTEVYPDQLENGFAQPKITHMCPEPVSEVFLTDGTILRQTYFGRTPSGSSHPGDSQTNSPTVHRKISSIGKVIPRQASTETTCQSRKTSMTSGSTTKGKIGLSLSLNCDRSQDVADQDTKRMKVGSPYMVIQSPLPHTEQGSVKSQVKEDDDTESNTLEPTSKDIGDPSKQSQEKPTETDGVVDDWMEKRQYSVNVEDDSRYASDSEMSLDVECNSDRDELSETDITGEEEDSSNFPESEVQSEVEVAEEESGYTDSIEVGQSAVDFAENSALGKESSENTKIKIAKKIEPKKETLSRTSSFAMFRAAGFTEFPKMKEEKHEKFQYLTPKEVKAMQIARRRRTEWENRVRKNSPIPKKEDKDILNEVLNFENEHFGCIPVTEDKIGKNKSKSFNRSSSYKSALNKTAKVAKSASFRSWSPPNASSSATVSKTKPKSMTNPKKHPKKTISKAANLKAKSTQKASQITVKPRKSNPLIKRLVQNTFDAVDSGRKKSLVKKQDSSDRFTKVSSTFKPIQTEDVTDGLHPLNITDLDDKIEFKTTEVEKNLVKTSTSSSNFQDLKKLGHRRMKSAPLHSTKSRLQTDVHSDHTPKNVFASVNEQSEMRSRSSSMANHGVKELNKMAEIVCNEDRIDAERDVLEVLQVANCDATSVQSNVTKQTVVKRKSSSQILTDDKEDSFSKKKPGHRRHMSLQYRFLSYGQNDLDLPEGKLSASGEVPGSNKRGGSDKMKKIISQFLPNAHFQPIARPFPSSEQYMPQVNGSSCIVINEKEPTSLIAYTLSSTEYKQHLQNIQDLMAGKKVSNTFLQPNSSLLSQPNTPSPTRKQLDIPLKIPNNLPSSNFYQKPDIILRSGASSSSSRPRSWTGPTDITISIDEVFNALPGEEDPPLVTPALRRMNGVGKRHPLASVELDPIIDGVLVRNHSESCDDLLESLKSAGVPGEDVKKKDDKIPIDYHIKLQFENSVAKFFCSAYYAEQFRELRALIFPEGEERFIQSLTRCKFWKATGGKSGSSFSKSLDDRFVMKQMSRLEIQSFVDFAPRYFAYINKAIKENWPTAIAKLLGVYRIGFKNSVTNTTMRQDVLVMENLFYEKKVNKIFDLKGSVRSRYVHRTAKEDVLMDENLLEMICDSPLFIRAHSKAVLSKAIYNDTEFLSNNMVMDYSLLVGIDETRSELVVGIIDYIRTYTWDKKLESYVKSTGILGGQGKMPTVVSPEVYRTRFTEAMQRYFLMVPDKWTGFGADLS